MLGAKGEQVRPKEEPLAYLQKALLRPIPHVVPAQDQMVCFRCAISDAERS